MILLHLDCHGVFPPHTETFTSVSPDHVARKVLQGAMFGKAQMAAQSVLGKVANDFGSSESLEKAARISVPNGIFGRRVKVPGLHSFLCRPCTPKRKVTAKDDLACWH